MKTGLIIDSIWAHDPPPFPTHSNFGINNIFNFIFSKQILICALATPAVSGGNATFAPSGD